MGTRKTTTPGVDAFLKPLGVLASLYGTFLLLGLLFALSVVSRLPYPTDALESGQVVWVLLAVITTTLALSLVTLLSAHGIELAVVTESGGRHAVDLAAAFPEGITQLLVALPVVSLLVYGLRDSWRLDITTPSKAVEMTVHLVTEYLLVVAVVLGGFLLVSALFLGDFRLLILHPVAMGIRVTVYASVFGGLGILAGTLLNTLAAALSD